MHILWLVGVLGVGGIIYYRLCYLPMIITEVAIEVVLLPPLAFPVSEVDVECRGSVTFEIRIAQLHYLRYGIICIVEHVKDGRGALLVQELELQLFAGLLRGENLEGEGRIKAAYRAALVLCRLVTCVVQVLRADTGGWFPTARLRSVSFSYTLMFFTV